MTKLLLLLIRVYQLTLSPLLGPCCRFTPSCSHYAMQCIEHHGVLAGCWLALKRLLRCHPFHPGGYDPPPSVGNHPVTGKTLAGKPSRPSRTHWLASSSGCSAHAGR